MTDDPTTESSIAEAGNIIRFSDTVIRQLPFPASGDYKDYRDTRKAKLVLRVRPTSKTFYVVTRRGEQMKWLKIGKFPEVNTAEAHRRTDELLLGLANPANDPQALNRKIRQQQEAAKNTDKVSLSALCDAYVKFLEDAGKSSVSDVRSAFKCHVQGKRIAAKPARDITPADIADLIRSVVDSGKRTLAQRLRSHLSAAFSRASKVSIDAGVGADFKVFEVSHNPVVDVATVAEANNTSERSLSLEELHDYLDELHKLPSAVVRDALLTMLLLGGQRAAQTIRLTRGDVADDNLILWDGKGKRSKPRAHKLPLFGEVQTIISRRCEGLDKPDNAVFWGHGAPVAADTISHAVKTISDAIVIGKPNRKPFDLRDIRRTCETLLAGMGVSKDLRAQIQSHGLGGVQSRHYDRHDYLAEKREALEAWCKMVNQRRAKKARRSKDGTPEVEFTGRLKERVERRAETTTDADRIRKAKKQAGIHVDSE